MTRREKALERAKRHVGHREVTPNRSPLIDEWVTRCGLDHTKGLPWCAAFASWCVGTVALGSALRLGRAFPGTGAPLPGDLMWFPTDELGHGHCGIVVDTNASDALCIEGNSANMVRYTRRLLSEVHFSSTFGNDWEGVRPPWPECHLIRVEKAGTL